MGHTSTTTPTTVKIIFAMACVNSHQNRLYLVARLPRRDGQPGIKQARIALRIDDTPVNRRAAERQLKILKKQIETNTFDWSYWHSEHKNSLTWNEVISRLYRQKVILGRTSENTWNINYMGRLRQLKPGAICTTESIEDAILKYDRSTCSYKELFYLMKHIARIAGVPFPEIPIPTYTDSALVSVPTDEEIISWVKQFDPIPAWYFGMMATYGLRPHEIESAQFTERDYIQVQDKTKTGFRTVVPVPREWIKLFNLKEIMLRGSFSARPDHVAKWLSKELYKLKIPYKPYSLRHAYAARLWRTGGSRLDIYTASRLMGHSAQQHTKTYRAHIQPHHVAETAERALLQQD